MIGMDLFEKLQEKMNNTDYTTKPVIVKKLTDTEQRWKEITADDPEEFFFNEV